MLRPLVNTADLLAARYRLVSVLGQGSMGRVWRAHDTVLNREIALKERVTSSGVDRSEAADRFLVEAQAAAMVIHPNIVGVYDVFREGDSVFLALELVSGPTLYEVAQLGRLEASSIRSVLSQVAQALGAAHSAGVVHRDLKPDNIFWTPEGRVVVADFGLARIGPGRGTLDGTVMGTLGYIAPEQVRGLVVGPAADVFGWAVIGYELATGAPLFGDPMTSDAVALAYRIVHEEPPPLDLPDDPELASIITSALAKDPADRPRDGNALIALLTSRPAGSDHKVPPLLHLGAFTTVEDGAGDADRARVASRGRVWLFGLVLAVVLTAALATGFGRGGRAGDTFQALPAAPVDTPSTTSRTSESTVTMPTAPPPPSPATGPVVYQDSFSANRGWPVGDVLGVMWEVQDGRYTATQMPASTTLYTVSRAPLSATQVPGSVGVQVSVTFGPSPRNSLIAGVLCRSQGRPKYFASIHPNGAWSVERIGVDAAADRSLALGRLPDTPAPGDPIVLELDCTGSNDGGAVSLAFRVNGRLVSDIRETDGLPGGQMGVAGGGREGSPVSFDDFSVTRLP